MTLDFTLKRFGEICQTALDSDYRILTIEEYIRNPNCFKNLIVLRHDVDRKPSNAIKMAQLEHTLGITSTYYFRHVPDVFRPDIMQRISEMGHEIGYHYETLSKMHGNFEEAIKLFGEELADFRKWVPVKTASMHGSPLSPFNNRDLWEKYDFKQFDLTGEAYLSIDYKNLQYFTDTGRTWRRTHFNLRDFTDSMRQDYSVKTSIDIQDRIQNKIHPRICISAHPERWNSNAVGWLLSFGFDLSTNLAKSGLRLLRRTPSK